MKTYVLAICQKCLNKADEYQQQVFMGNKKHISTFQLKKCLIWSYVAYSKFMYSRTSVARTSLGSWKFVRDMGSSSHWGLIIAPGQEAAGLDGSVGCAVRLETRRSRVQPPPRSATFFRGDWSWNIFYGHSLPSADSRRAVVSFWRKNMHNTG